MDVLGANFREVNEQEKKDLKINYGLVVTKVNKGAIREAGIVEKFVILNANDQPMKTIDDLQEAVKTASKSKDPVLMIKGIFPSGKVAYKVVNLQEE